MPLADQVDALVVVLSRDARVRAWCQRPLPREYSYASLTAMLLDAIFSIGVRYEQVKALIARHAKRHQYDPWQSGNVDPYPLPELIEEGEQGTPLQFAEKLDNRCRTSTRSGILKAEAVLLAAASLVRHDIVDLPSWRSRSADEAALEATGREFRSINGQRSGLSWNYLCMLAGDDNRVKPDRMVVRYVETALRRERVLPKEAADLLVAATTALCGTSGYPPALTARQLDSAIWNVARSSTQQRLRGGIRVCE